VNGWPNYIVGNSKIPGSNCSLDTSVALEGTPREEFDLEFCGTPNWLKRNAKEGEIDKPFSKDPS
jgi:hypothetical protein